MKPTSILQALPDGRTQVRFDGLDLVFADLVGSAALEHIANGLLCDTYGLMQIEFSPGDVVVDVGAHVGVVSSYLARRHPGLHVLALEPHPDIFRCLKQNLLENGAELVDAFNSGVSADARDLDLFLEPANSGATSAFKPSSPHSGASRSSSVQLASFLGERRIRRCRMLKVDCEGMEYEILRAPEALATVDYLSVELHFGTRLNRSLEDAQELLRDCQRWLSPSRVHASFCDVG